MFRKRLEAEAKDVVHSYQLYKTTSHRPQTPTTDCEPPDQRSYIDKTPTTNPIGNKNRPAAIEIPTTDHNLQSTSISTD